MIGPISRIIARYISAALVTYGVMSPADATALHPELVVIAGASLGAAVELFYAVAKRRGWVT